WVRPPAVPPPPTGRSSAPPRQSPPPSCKLPTFSIRNLARSSKVQPHSHSRMILRALWILLAALIVALPGRLGAAPEYDVAILGGRVMDPATGTDRVANVAVRGGRVGAVGGGGVGGRRDSEARGPGGGHGRIDRQR